MSQNKVENFLEGRRRICGSWATRLGTLTAHHRSGGGAARQNQKMLDGAAGLGKPDEKKAGKLENSVSDAEEAGELRGRRPGGRRERKWLLPLASCWYSMLVEEARYFLRVRR